MNSFFHAVSSVKKWNGTIEDYIDIHEFIDSSKKIIADSRHRSIYHHTEGIWLCQRIFGRAITLEGGRKVPVRLIAERHVEEDLGWIPSPKDYIDSMPLKQWMSGSIHREVSLTELFPEPEPNDPSSAPLIADPTLITHLIGFGIKVPPPYPEPKYIKER